MGGGEKAGDRQHGWKKGQVLRRAKEHVTMPLLMCYINTHTHTHLWMNQPISQLKDSEEVSEKKPEEALRTPCCLLMLCNTLHSLLSFHRRCKDTIVLTVLQPHQVRLMRCSLAFIFLSHGSSLTPPLFYQPLCYTDSFSRVLLQPVHSDYMLIAYISFPKMPLHYGTLHITD